jgi:hypothetical protein
MSSANAPVSEAMKRRGRTYRPLYAAGEKFVEDGLGRRPTRLLVPDP